jgi:lipopolysaccharide biosynthesis glycosyltransferase
MSKIYIYYSADKNLYTQLLVSLISLAENNKQHEIHVLNLDMELKEYGPYPNKLSLNQIKTCEKILKQYNKNNTFTEIDVSALIKKYLLKGPNMKMKGYKYPPFLYARYLIAFLENIPDKII